MKIKVTTPPDPILTVENLPVGTVFECGSQVYTKVLVDGLKPCGISVVWGNGYPKKLGVFSNLDAVPEKIVRYPADYTPPKQPREFVLTVSAEEMRLLRSGLGSLSDTKQNLEMWNQINSAISGE